MAMISCYECKKAMEKKSAIKFNNHYYHSECYSAMLARNEFSNYVCKLMGLKSPGPKIWHQRRLLNESGIDDYGIIRTLKYVYEVLKFKISEDKSPDFIGIGLVSEYYCESEDYWAREENKERMKMRTVEEAIEKEKEIQTVVVTRSSNKKEVNLLEFVPTEGE